MPTFSNGESGLSVRTKINNAITRVDGLQTTSNPAFAGLTVNGNITVTGAVDGRDVSVDGAKLDGIEAGATADQTAAEIKAAYESNADTNAFTDAEQALVAGALQASNNLSDVASAPTALTNLGLTATAAELNTLDGITASTAELNILDGVTATAAEINTLDGITASTAELNLLDGVTVTTAQINSIAQFTGRNLIINGSGRINQRGYVSGAATSGANQFTLDRWFVVTSGQNLAFTGNDSARVMTAPAGGVSQVIESANVVGGTYVLNWTGTATATVGGVARTKGETFALTANTNVTVTFTSGTFSEVQLEAGSIVTPFERRTFGQELALCQRYYEKTFDYSVAPASNAGLAGALGTTSGGAVAAAAQASWHFAVTKRATPTVATFNPSAAGSDWRNVNSAGVNAAAAATQIGLSGVTIVISGTPEAQRRHSIHVVADAELTS